MLQAGSIRGDPQCGIVHFDGQVQYKNGTPQMGFASILTTMVPARSSSPAVVDLETATGVFRPAAPETAKDRLRFTLLNARQRAWRWPDPGGRLAAGAKVKQIHRDGY